MGIKGLYKIIADNSPAAIKAVDYKILSGRKVAIDASMSLYQFLIAVRQQDGQQLTNENGETTSHLIGMFYRTLRLIDNGLKPVYVFDGKPPDLKGEELSKRQEKQAAAQKQAEDLKETGTAEEIAKYERRTVRVTKEQNEEAKRLLRLMGIPYIDAPGEAEAQCAALAKADKVFAAASEDMDTLTFATPFLLRHLTVADQKKQPIIQIEMSKVLQGLEMTHEQFVDMCILLGCDYCDTIRGIGPTTALKLMKEHGSLDKIIEELKKKDKYKVPEDWPLEKVRELFHHPEVADPVDVNFKWTEPDLEGLIAFLVGEKGFSEERVKAGAARLTKGVKTTPQGRLTDFFKISSTTPAPKRKGAEKDKKSIKKRK